MKELQAYKIMIRFLDDQYFRGGWDDLAALLGSLALLEDGNPADSAMVDDWNKAVEATSKLEHQNRLVS